MPHSEDADIDEKEYKYHRKQLMISNNLLRKDNNIHRVKKQEKTMNRDEGQYTLSRVFDDLLVRWIILIETPLLRGIY